MPEYQPDLHAGLSADTRFRHRTRILVAHDDPFVLRMLRDVLDHGCEVITAQRGDAALQKVFSDLPDLVVLDIRMPGMNGHEVCDRIKRHPITRDTPVIGCVPDMKRLLCSPWRPESLQGESRAEANTGNFTNSLKGLSLSLLWFLTENLGNPEC